MKLDLLTYATNDIKDAIEGIIGILNLPHTSRYGASIGFKTNLRYSL